MSKFTIYFETSASTSVEIEADNEAQALDKAGNVDLPQLCAQCSGWGQDLGIELGEWETGSVEAS